MEAKQYYLTKDQIKVGDKVKISQLYKITDTYILIKDIKDSEDYLGMYTSEGVIADIYNQDEEPNVDPDTIESLSSLFYQSSATVDWNIVG